MNPSGVQYSVVLNRATPAVKQTRKFSANNGSTFTDSTNNIIRIPLAVGSFQFVDTRASYLSFTITNNSSDKDAKFDTNGNCVIQRLRIESPDGSTLEDITDWNVLNAFLHDYTQGLDNGATISNMIEGQGTAVPNTTKSYANNSCVAIGEGASISVCLPLAPCGVLNANRYLPLGFLRSNLVIEIHLAPAATCLNWETASPTAPGYTLSNVNYVADIISFSSQFNQNYEQMISNIGGVQISTQTYSNYITNIANAQSALAELIPARQKSIKSIFFIMRHTADISTKNIDSLSARQRNALTAFQIKVGGALFPAQEVQGSSTNSSEMGAELYKAFARLADTSLGGKITRANYLSAEGGFAFGLDLEAFANDSSVIESGLNVGSQGLPVELIGNLTADGASQLNSYVLSDMILTFTSDGGVLSSM